MNKQVRKSRHVGGAQKRKEVRTRVKEVRTHMLEPKAETMSRAQLAKLQLERLKKTLHHAYKNVPAVKQRFEQAGVKPDDVKHLEDIVRLPFSTKKDLFDNYPFGLFAVPREKLVRIHASSGTTTGRPTVVGYTRRDLDNWASLVARSMAATGAHSGDVVHNAFGYGLFTGGLGMHYGSERLGCTVVPMSGGNTHRQIVALRDLGATVICATPSYSLHLAEVAEKEGFDLRSGSLRLGIFGAEPWTEAMRTELEARLGLTAVDIYGLSEIMGPGVAGECIEARQGLHCWEDHFLFEIVDLETGESLPAGKTGELVITTLTKEALPMIRYRTRDITSATTERCACGRTHMRIRKLSGRTDDMMIIRGVNVYPSQIEEVLVGFPNVAPHYQLVIRREGPMDTLQVEAEALPEVVVETYATIADQVTYHIKSKIGVTCHVEVKGPGEVPRFEGKAIRVRDLRNL